MAIKKFDRATVLMAREEIEKAIKEACDRLGIKAPTLGNISFTDHSITTAKLVFGIQTQQMDKDTVRVGQVFRQGAGRFTVKTIHDTYVIASSARGKNYRITYKQLNEMVTDNKMGHEIGKSYGIS